MAFFKKQAAQKQQQDDIIVAQVQDTSKPMAAAPQPMQSQQETQMQADIDAKIQRLDRHWKAYVDEYAGVYQFPNAADEQCSLLLGILTEMTKLNKNMELLLKEARQ